MGVGGHSYTADRPTLFVRERIRNSFVVEQPPIVRRNLPGIAPGKISDIFARLNVQRRKREQPTLIVSVRHTDHPHAAHNDAACHEFLYEVVPVLKPCPKVERLLVQEPL
ncbi:hypothetical protein IU452_20750 [Nocardia transvalensis]|nr:hypothetical protein [Nocardia transvalensis]